MCTELCSALLALNTKLGHRRYLSLPLGSLGSSFGRSAWTLGSRTRGLFVLGVGLWQKLKVDFCALFTELYFFPRYCALVIYLSESSSQFCSPIPNSREQLFNYLKAESMSSSYLLFFKEKKNPGPINHYSSEIAAMLPPIWWPFFGITLILSMSIFIYQIYVVHREVT